MNEAFKTALSLSCSGALLIAALRLSRPLLQSRLSKLWQYYIWLVVIARLLLPFAPEINLMGTLFQRSGHDAIQTEAVTPFGQSAPSAPEGERPSGAFAEGALRLQNQRSAPAVTFALWPFWLVTALLLLIRKITIYQSFVSYIKAGCTEAADIGLLEQFGKLVEQSGVKPAVELCTNSLVSSPLLIGFFRPCIVLPTVELSDSEFQYTVLHELTHFKRRDMFYKWLVQAVVCLHWFNPLVYLMRREVERACELSCDEAVIQNLNARERRAYGDTLLRAAGRGGRYRTSIAAVTLSENRDCLRERLDAIACFQRKAGYARPLAIVLTAAVCLGAAAAGAYAAGPSAKPSAVGALTLMEKEYTVEELAALSILDISILTLSDDVSVVRGGDTLKFEYYALDSTEYRFQLLKSSPDNRQDLILTRSSPSDAGAARSITVTIPRQFQPKALQIATTSGSVSLTDCAAESIDLYTQNGQIDVQGSSAARHFTLQTETGDALVAGTALPDSRRNASYCSAFTTRSGTVFFQPEDSAENYCFLIDYGEEAQVFINNEGIEAIELLDGDPVETPNSDPEAGNPQKPDAGTVTEYIKKPVFTINESAGTRIHFNSPRGSLIVQEE